jgi:hypothetical protein
MWIGNGWEVKLENVSKICLALQNPQNMTNSMRYTSSKTFAGATIVRKAEQYYTFS